MKYIIRKTYVNSQFHLKLLDIRSLYVIEMQANNLCTRYLHFRKLCTFFLCISMYSCLEMRCWKSETSELKHVCIHFMTTFRGTDVIKV